MILGYSQYQCLKATLIRADAQAPVLGHQVSTQPKILEWHTSLENNYTNIKCHVCFLQTLTVCTLKSNVSTWTITYVAGVSKGYIQKWNKPQPLIWRKYSQSVALYFYGLKITTFHLRQQSCCLKSFTQSWHYLVLYNF